MTWYEFVLFLHIAMAVIWVGGGFLLQMLALRVMATGDDARKAAFAGDAEVLGMRVFAPSSPCCCSPGSRSSRTGTGAGASRSS